MNVSNPEVTAAAASTEPREIHFDGRTLKAHMRRADRIQKVIAVGLVVLPVSFLFFSILVPITAILWSSIHSPTVSRELPNLAIVIKQWDGLGKPPPAVVRTFLGDLLSIQRRHRVGRIVWRLNQEVPGYRSFLFETAGRLELEADRVGGNTLLARPDLLAWMVEQDPRWRSAKILGWLTPSRAEIYVGLSAAHDRFEIRPGR